MCIVVLIFAGIAIGRVHSLFYSLVASLIYLTTAGYLLLNWSNRLIETIVMRHRLSHICALLITCVLADPACGWGREGHVIVAQIAEMHLNIDTRSKVDDLLDLDTDSRHHNLAYASIWPDLIKSPKHPEHQRYRYARPMHYVNIPEGVASYDRKRDCPKGNCVIEAIHTFAKVLTQSNDPREQLVALKFLVHFVGDIHQPLHVGYKRDSGGNDVSVRFFNQRTNLHRVWDSMILRRDGASGKNVKQYAITLGEAITTEQRGRWSANSDPTIWTTEARTFLASHCYHLPSGHEIGQDYQDHCLPATHQQLQKAGIRLAVLLNKMFE